MDKSTFCKTVRIERTDDLTELLENICQDNNINNYFGTISVAVEGVLNFIFAASKKQSEKIKFGFEQCVGGVSISIECESVSFEALVKKAEQSEQTDNTDALVIASAASIAAVSPLVSTIPNASCAMFKSSLSFNFYQVR